MQNIPPLHLAGPPGVCVDDYGNERNVSYGQSLTFMAESLEIVSHFMCYSPVSRGCWRTVATPSCVTPVEQ